MHQTLITAGELIGTPLLTLILEQPFGGPILLPSATTGRARPARERLSATADRPGKRCQTTSSLGLAHLA
jgi:hypothetical protein